MPEFDSLRTLLRDRQKKAGALGSTTVDICLDTSLIADLEQLEIRKAATIAVDPAETPRLGGRPKKDTTELDQQIAAKNAEIAAVTMELTFRSLSSVAYQRIVNAHDDTHDERGRLVTNKWHAFLDHLASECLTKVKRGGKEESDDFDWSEICDGLTFGEWEPMVMAVLRLNQRLVEVPFSSKPSANTQ